MQKKKEKNTFKRENTLHNLLFLAAEAVVGPFCLLHVFVRMKPLTHHIPTGETRVLLE